MKARLMGYFVVLFCLAVCSACRNDEITSYAEHKESFAPADAAVGKVASGVSGAARQRKESVTDNDLASVPPSLTWTTPAHWKELPPTSMRIGSFLIEQSEKRAEVSVIPLAGPAGGNLANVNRWRDQIGLGPMSQEDLDAQSEQVETPAGKMLLVDFSGTEALIDNRFKPRVIAAVLPKGNTTWFFKMTGEESLTASEKQAFKDFLNSIRFTDVPA